MLGTSSGSFRTKAGFAAVGVASVGALVLSGCSSAANGAGSGASSTAEAQGSSQSSAASGSAAPGSASASQSAAAKASQSASATASTSASAKASQSGSGAKKPSSSYNMGGNSNSSSKSQGKGTSGSKARPTKAPSYRINPQISVSKSKHLSSGDFVTVTGTGFDNTKGIYVAFCVITGGKPTPCGGGADTDGSSGKSEWISSNPPTYGVGLAKPFGPNGSFSVQIKVSKNIGSFDCTSGGCGVSTRADHTRSSDRSTDRWIKVTFD